MIFLAVVIVFLLLNTLKLTLTWKIESISFSQFNFPSRPHSSFLQGSLEELIIFPGRPNEAVNYCEKVKECKTKVTKKDRVLEPVEVLPQSTRRDIQGAERIPDEFVVKDGTTYYVSFVLFVECFFTLSLFLSTACT